MKTRDRVSCYITRGQDLLVFEYFEPRDEISKGVWIVGGGVDEGETWVEAATREALEECGLALSKPVFLGTHELVTHGPVYGTILEKRHYFWFETPIDTPNCWEHIVSDGESDKGMIFKHRFVPLAKVKLDWEFDKMLPQLEERLNVTSG